MTETTIRKLIPEFLADLETKKRSPSTVIAYRADLQQLEKYLETKNIASIAQIASGDLATFRDWLLEKKYTPKSASRKLNALKTFFRWAISANHLTSDPSKDVSHPKIDPSKPKFLSPLEYRALRDIARDDPRISSIIEVILQTGLRISEVANLKVEHVQEEEVHIEAYATQAERKVPLNKAAKQALDAYIKNHRPEAGSPHVFVSKNGKPLATRNIRAAIDRFFQKAEIAGYSVNDLRTTFIVENLKRDVDLVLLSQVAGHKRLSTTERYLELAGVISHGKKQKLEEL
ncbi:hypothetical protein A3D84_05665 [Candidatus Woesebacteria bacterium RIFCSPHIGHO2_02_FULL_42_20]|uniref:Tyrosine recombinase XerC n=1 Tax=Candidatus Woesebacteria bacterium RIFCSPHIGHO2_12_FULL_41_24 TaxID=1802510 RepID=A0A1F8AUX3_9BACT|nr:MAG: hypothetical protein A2W15_01225 [Candidatus Woesebacteria bacterium RBG_16_41_13]OGM30394.1 MAG: hypothetical protein A2873_00350 [Candidatus Woesebacteria bacterium RIFCSPHIGHO2_01_FULL_42_80]OGM35440.1 MAG: hypothetical protein A3D84_05665 [Candidatus Woesebacteria bacterium RIFCSPHIGHO2_02_FULL_42_20]OGM55015.1 MAG: hypothetical protein A3E44_04650 [Candidatus Woesebacteria bacterium RIFCSPHIGHO2_12_FULL_41_24]OGM66361.1 MAG: hypothetical protein A2969_00270 [Candidatus Woesebacteri